MWYRRYEIQKRMAFLYVAAALAGAFSGLLAYAIEQMDGMRGLKGWQWIFIIEGIIPLSLSLFVWKIIPDWPESAKFLNKHEKEFIINRLALETGSGRGRVTNADKLRPYHVWNAMKEWKIWAGTLTFLSSTIALYGFTATVPTVIESMGYTSAMSQLLTVPIYFVAAILIIVFAFWSEKVQQRSLFLLAGFSLAACGFIAQLILPQTRLHGATYGALFPMAAGIFSVAPGHMSWMANNMAPSSKRAVGVGLLISVANLGGIVGSNIYLESQSPKYPTGFGMGLGMSIVGITMTLILRFAFARENAIRRKMLAEEGEEAIRARYTEQELLDMGDKSPFFVYTL